MSEHDSLVSDGELLGRERHSFECLGRKALAHAAPRIAWCPTMDLLAVADATQAVRLSVLVCVFGEVCNGQNGLPFDY